jgi:hypothetical protein
MGAPRAARISIHSSLDWNADPSVFEDVEVHPHIRGMTAGKQLERSSGPDRRSRFSIHAYQSMSA